MYGRILLAVAIILSASQVNAQSISASGSASGPSGTMTFGAGNGVFSSTIAEGYLRGLGAYWVGAGHYLESLGIYENMHEAARAKYMQNEGNRIRGRLYFRDLGKARRKALYKDWITREHERLDWVLKRVELDQRKAEMRKAGVLPAQPHLGFTWHGQRFRSYAEFTMSPVYGQFLAERDERQAAEAVSTDLQQKQRQNALKLGKKHQGMSITEWEIREHRERASRAMKTR